jgi:hypothetical protein
MTQLIENKPPRRALIATLSQFCASRRRFVGRSSSSDITGVARTRYRCAGSLAACTRSTVQGFYGRIQPPASGLQHRKPNRNIRRLETHLTPAISIRAPRLIATNRILRIRVFAVPTQVHNRPCCGHAGRMFTIRRVRQRDSSL